MSSQFQAFEQSTSFSAPPPPQQTKPSVRSVSSIPGSLEGTALGLGSKHSSKKQMCCAKALLSWAFNSTAEH